MFVVAVSYFSTVPFTYFLRKTVIMYVRSLKLFTFIALLATTTTIVRADDSSQLLKKDVGTWNCEIKFYADPSAPPAVSKGTETCFMVGENWLVSDFKGDIMGSPFQGHSLTRFDSENKKFVSTWIDSMSPHAMSTEGTWDETTQTLTSTGVGKDPTGNETKHKMTVVYL